MFADLKRTKNFLLTELAGGGGRGGGGVGSREKREREVYGRREAGFPRWREVGEIGGSYATLHNILQSKKHKEVGAHKNRAGTGIKGMGSRKFKPPAPPPPPPTGPSW